MTVPAPQPPLRAAIYDRASKDRSARAKSVGEQRVGNQAACADNGWAIAETYTDNHRSASRFARTDRPDWDRFLADLDARSFDVVVMWESSRGDRKASQWIAFLDSCRELGVLIHVTSHRRTYDMRVARDWRVLAEDGVDNAYETEKLSERIRRGLRGNAVEGRPHGKVLYGYVRQYNPRTGDLVGQEADERKRVALIPACVTARPVVGVGEVYTRAGVVREVASRFAGGATQRALVVDLNRRGIPAPEGGIWRTPQLRSILLNPAYIGYRRHQGEVVPSPVWFPPILAPDVHYACTSRMGDPQRRGARDSSVKHLLSGLATCGLCGGWMRVLVEHGRGGARYVCQPTTPDRTAGRHAVRGQARVEEYVEGLAIAWMAQPEPVAVLTQDASGGDGEHQRVLGQIGELRARLDGLYDQAATGGLSATGLARVERRILADIAELEAASRRLRGRLVLAPARVGSVEGARSRWDGWDVAARREFLRGLFSAVEIMPLGDGRRGYSDQESVRVTWHEAAL
ncbi:recombinase family protein [Sphaerisporangium sp. NBC_01403]|uniref:recombinase family protein n=1 Tax=Sphaerisporangium sp. NBC_01403 TaxID=2903599 RepID=UPI00324A3BD3